MASGVIRVGTKTGSWVDEVNDLTLKDEDSAEEGAADLRVGLHRAAVVHQQLRSGTGRLWEVNGTRLGRLVRFYRNFKST